MRLGLEEQLAWLAAAGNRSPFVSPLMATGRGSSESGSPYRSTDRTRRTDGRTAEVLKTATVLRLLSDVPEIFSYNGVKAHLSAFGHVVWTTVAAFFSLP
jgi:hypothetical protein